MDARAALSKRRPWRELLIVLLCIGALAALFHTSVRDQVQKLDYWTADWRTLLLADRILVPHPKIVLVLIDRETLEELAPVAASGGVPRDLSAQVIRAVSAAKPAVIGLDYYFTKATEAEKDRKLVEAIQGVPSIVVGAANEGTEQLNAGEFAFQREFLSRMGRPSGYINLRHDGDDVIRRTSPPVHPTDYPDSFAARIANSVSQRPDTEVTSAASVRIAWLVRSDESRIAWLLRAVRLMMIPSFGDGPKSPPELLAAEAFASISARDLVPGSHTYNRSLVHELENKIALISVNLSYQDKHRTPLSSGNDGEIGVVIHAQILAQYLDGRQYTELSRSGADVLLICLALCGFFLSAKLKGTPSYLWDQTAATAVLVMIDAVVYSQFRLILPFTLALYTWVIAVIGGERLPILNGWWRDARHRGGRRAPIETNRKELCSTMAPISEPNAVAPPGSTDPNEPYQGGP